MMLSKIIFFFIFLGYGRFDLLYLHVYYFGMFVYPACCQLTIYNSAFSKLTEDLNYLCLFFVFIIAIFATIKMIYIIHGSL